MPISLRSIEFDRTSSNTAAWSVPDSSGSSPVSTDWQRFGTTVSSSAVAYSLARLSRLPGKSTLTISANTTLPLANVYLRAAQNGIARSSSTRVNTPAGAFSFQVSIPTADWIAHGTHEWHERWEWESSTDQTNWTKFDQSTHDVFVIPDDPGVSWDLGTGLAHRPWRSVLSLACGWADGATDAVTAVAEITTRINDLGGKKIHVKGSTVTVHYHTGGSDYNLANQFAMNEFLRLARLERDITAPYFNCLDAAGAVVVLSNALGARLKMVCLCPANNATTFRTTAVLGAGSKSTRSMQFEIHAVAVSNDNSGAIENCWEPCFRLDLDGVAPLDLAAKLPFNVGKADYLDRLISGTRPTVQGPQTVLIWESGDEPTDRDYCDNANARIWNIILAAQWTVTSDEAIQAVRAALQESSLSTEALARKIGERSYERLSAVLGIEDERAVTVDLWKSRSQPDAAALAFEMAITSSELVDRIEGYADLVLGSDRIGEYLLVWGRVVMRVRHPNGRAGLNQVLQQVASNLIL